MTCICRRQSNVYIHTQHAHIYTYLHTYTHILTYTYLSMETARQRAETLFIILVDENRAYAKSDFNRLLSFSMKVEKNATVLKMC